MECGKEVVNVSMGWFRKDRHDVEYIRRLADHYGFEVSETKDYIIVEDTKGDVVGWLKFFADVLAHEREEALRDIPRI